MIDLVQLYAACLGSTALRSREKKLQGKLDDIIRQVAKDHQVPLDFYHFTEAVNLLEELKVATAYVHDGMDNFYKIDGAEFNSTFGVSKGGWVGRGYRFARPFDKGDETFEVLESFADLGDVWLLDALSAYRPFILERHKLHSLAGSNSADNAESDRIVDLKDDHDLVSTIDAELAKIESELRTNNEIGDTFGDHKSVAISEIANLRNLLTASKVRARTLLNYATEVLSWVGKKAAENSLSEIVKHATKLFIGWLS